MDMERDALKNIIVPKLNEAFIHKKLHISLVDLRHSIETDSSLNVEERENRIFQVCMDEIDSCKPYFMGLVGHRYGWIPDFTGAHAQLSDRLSLPHDFPIPADKLSVTVCEFIHGLFSETKSVLKSFVLIRGMDSYSRLDPDSIKEYIDKGENGELAEKFRRYLAGAPGNANIIPYDLDLSEVGGNALQEWCDTIYKKLYDEFNGEYESNTSTAQENYIISQMKFINKHSCNFKGRQDVVNQCMEVLKNRGALYLYQDTHGLGATSLACHLYNLFSNEEKYLCLYHNTDTSSEADTYDTIFYYWNRQILEFLGMGHTHLNTIRNNADALYEELCRLYKLVNNKGVKLIIIEEGLSRILGHYQLKFPFNYLIKVLETGERGSLNILYPYIVVELDDNDYNLITAGLRSSVRSALSAKKNARNVKWLQKAVHILEHLNHSDYTLIRLGEQEDNREENISKYMEHIVDAMPDDSARLSLFWIERLKNIYGEFAVKYLHILSVTCGINDDVMSELTGRNTDWCTYFRYMLGQDIVFENGDGFIEINNEIGLMLRQVADHNFHEKICSTVLEYLKSIPSTSEIYQRNYFPVALYQRNCRLCLEYISDEGNYSDFIMESPAMSALYRMARHETPDFLSFIGKMIQIAPMEYMPFHMMNRWLYKVCFSNVADYISLASEMVARLEDSFMKMELGSNMALSLVEIYYSLGTAHIRFSSDSGENEWQELNRKAMTFCEEHKNESLEWNAMLVKIMYDTYDGLNSLKKRWRFLEDCFMPVERDGIDYDFRPGFVFYALLLKEYALLLPRFSDSGDTFTYIKHAYDIADKILDKAIQESTINTSARFTVSDWLSTVLCLGRLTENYGTPTRDISLQIMKDAIEKMFTISDRYTHMTTRGVLFAELVALYAMRLSETDPQEAMHMVDRMTDLCIVMQECDTETDPSFNIPYHTRHVCFMTNTKKISYMDISFAWLLAARIHITQCGTVDVESRYPTLEDDFETLMRLTAGTKESIWNRELDNEFVLCTAIATKLRMLHKSGFPDKEAAKNLFNIYNTLSSRSSIHYRKSNFRQQDEVKAMESDLHSMIEGERKRLSREELENLIENEEFDTIIKLYEDVQSGSPDEFYYRGLALLRNGKASRAYSLYKILTDISNLPEGYLFSCKVNCLISALAAGMTREFEALYKSLSGEEKNDSDVIMLYQTYLELIASGKLNMKKPYGYML